MKYTTIPVAFLFLLFSCAPDDKGETTTAEEHPANSTLTTSNSTNTNANANTSTRALPVVPPNAATPYPKDLTVDSKEVQAIKAEVDSLDAKLKKKVAPTEMVSLNILSSRDQLAFWQTDDGMAKITMRIASKEFEVYPTYYMKDGEILYYHHRKWIKIDDPNITEMYVYFDNGKLLFAEERKITFEEGKGMPAMMASTPFEKSKRSEQEIMADFNEYWESEPIAERVKKVRSRYGK